MKKSKLLIILFIAVVLAGAVYFVKPITEWSRNGSFSNKEPADDQAEKLKTTLILWDGKTTSTMNVELPNGASALDQIKSAPVNATYKDYGDLGMLVESINGIAGNTKTNTYWIFYVNGQSATTGASQTKLKNNDTIMWRYEAAR